jgi:hypothetical protein
MKASNEYTIFPDVVALHLTLRLPVHDSALNFSTPDSRTYGPHQRKPQTVAVRVVYQGRKRR